MSDPPQPELSPEQAAENKGPLMLGVVWSFTTLASLFVAGRIWSRRMKIGRLAVDDYIILVSLALGLVFVAFLTVSIHYGSGRHAATLSVPDLEAAIMYITIAFTPGILSFTVPKFAVIILLCNLLNPSRIHRWFLWSMAVIGFIAIAIAIIVVWASCKPTYAMWTLNTRPVCWDPKWVMYTAFISGSISAFMDLYLALYPAIVLWSLQMNTKKKLGLSIALGFGIIAGAVAIHKCTTIPGVGNKTDFTFGTEGLVIWTSIESNCVIIAACVPMLLPLMEVIFGSNFMNGTMRLRYWPFSSSVKTTAQAHGSVAGQASRRTLGGISAAKSQNLNSTKSDCTTTTTCGDDLEPDNTPPGKAEAGSSSAGSGTDCSRGGIDQAEERSAARETEKS